MSAENFYMRNMERSMISHFNERHGLVTSYDDKKHLAKVTFMPEGEESGWLPIEEGHMGNGWGVLVGLTPGSGQGSGSGGAGSGGGSGGGSSGSGGSSGGQQYQGDQVIVRYQEGDLESAKIVKRVHSDTDRPPQTKAGEMLWMHSLGARLFMKADGSVHIYDRTSNQTDQSSGSGGGAGAATAGGGSSGGSSGGGSGSGSGQNVPLKNAPPLQPQSAKIMFDGKGKMVITHFQQQSRQQGQDPVDPTQQKSPEAYHRQEIDGKNLKHTTTTFQKGQGQQSGSSSGSGQAQPATNQGDPGMDSSTQDAKMFSQITHDTNAQTLTHTTFDSNGKPKFRTTMNTKTNIMKHESFADGQSVASTEWDDKGNIAHNCKGIFSCNAPQMQSTGNWQHTGSFQGTNVTATDSMGAATAAFGKLSGGPGGTANSFSGVGASPLAGGGNI